MTPAHLLNQTATITTRTASETLDSHGNPTIVETASEAKCWVHQTAADDTDDAQVSASQTLTCYFEPAAVVGAEDSVAVDGDTYEVKGPPWRVRHPATLGVSLIVASLRRAS